mmetsp:Transcript_32510/g.71363  ORF Transcript_32510/g.71363 Transcript_32510/m.71363 type:complete len:381 (-) Transcript_32510:206-1348(-)|eukprot:CAMPEP_0178476632 /NCGR_PEP_ID=MMETSP0696-20121128/3726_1 /TAXON_ID=265572 /ORGANISM="Extubocellulus spinifer, Strain CCMP396" /LENGTH=380 /DNA_ID=CAMNT_0020103939 /DNA_START=204 /DNA_END=1346 /DNA_ORIENTATION=-
MGKKSKRRGGQPQKPVGDRKGREARLPAIMSNVMSGGFTDPDINAKRWKFVDEVMSAAREPQDRSERDAFAAFTKIVAVVQKVSIDPRKLQKIEAELGVTEDNSLVMTCGHLRDMPFKSMPSKECRSLTLLFWMKMILFAEHLSSHEKAAYLTPIVDKEALLLLKTISSNENEAMHVRALAMTIRADTEWIVRRFSPTRFSIEASYRRRALMFVSKVDRRAVPIFLDVFSGRNRLSQIEGPPMASIENLSSRSGVINLCEATPFSVSVGGGYCDCCMKPREDEFYVFFKCKRCRLAHYCSKECQVRAWNHGHMQHCREYGHYKKGDVVVVEGTDKRHPYVMAVTGKAPTGLFSLQRLDDSAKAECLLVSAVNMRHVRPPA